MNLNRLSYLYPVKNNASIVLSAVCEAAKNRASQSVDRGYVQALTHSNNAPSLDEVFALVPVNSVKLWEVIDALYALRFDGHLDFDSFEVIELTDTLFQAIAEEWAYKLGSRPHHVGSEKIFARSRSAAEAIHQIRQTLNANSHA